MNKIKVAVTGGIGSGKTTVINIIKSLGYKTVNLDEVYAELLRDEKFVIYISEQFSIDPIKSESGYSLNKKALSAKVFSDKEQLDRLNGITHSKILERAFTVYDEDLVFYEVPLLFEGGYQSKFDYVFVVMRNKEQRLKSAALRDNCDPSLIINRMNNQVDYENMDLSLHTIIKNDGNVQQLTMQVTEAIDEVIKKI